MEGTPGLCKSGTGRCGCSTVVESCNTSVLTSSNGFLDLASIAGVGWHDIFEIMIVMCVTA